MFVEITGEVIRPGIYEYKEDDTFGDILNFSLGINSKANKSNISYVSILNNILSSSKIELGALINDIKLESIHVGTSTVREEKEIFVAGNGVSTGYFVADGESFNDFLSKLNFSTDIYPFFAVYEQELNMGMSRILNTFSLSDPSTYEALKSN